MSHKRDLKIVIADLEARGFYLVRQKNHMVYRHPDLPGQIVLSKTPTDGRAMKNAVASLRRFTNKR